MLFSRSFPTHSLIHFWLRVQNLVLMVPMRKRQKVQVVAQLIGMFTMLFSRSAIMSQQGLLKGVHVFPTAFLILRAPHCAFCTLGCGFLFGLQSFLFSSLIPLPGVFLCIYLFIYFLMVSCRKTNGDQELQRQSGEELIQYIV